MSRKASTIRRSAPMRALCCKPNSRRTSTLTWPRRRKPCARAPSPTHRLRHRDAARTDAVRAGTFTKAQATKGSPTTITSPRTTGTSASRAASSTASCMDSISTRWWRPAWPLWPDRHRRRRPFHRRRHNDHVPGYRGLSARDRADGAGSRIAGRTIVLGHAMVGTRSCFLRFRL